jgi:hypothetical protein
MTNILHDADDPARLRSEQPNALVERVLSWKVAFGRGAVDDGDLLRLLAIEVREITAVQKSDAHGSEVARRSRSEFGGELLAWSRRLTPREHRRPCWRSSRQTEND